MPDLVRLGAALVVAAAVIGVLIWKARRAKRRLDVDEGWTAFARARRFAVTPATLVTPTTFVGDWEGVRVSVQVNDALNRVSVSGPLELRMGPTLMVTRTAGSGGVDQIIDVQGADRARVVAILDHPLCREPVAALLERYPTLRLSSSSLAIDLVGTTAFPDDLDARLDAVVAAATAIQAACAELRGPAWVAPKDDTPAPAAPTPAPAATPAPSTPDSVEPDEDTSDDPTDPPAPVQPAAPVPRPEPDDPITEPLPDLADDGPVDQQDAVADLIQQLDVSTLSPANRARILEQTGELEFLLAIDQVEATPTSAAAPYGGGKTLRGRLPSKPLSRVQVRVPAGHPLTEQELPWSAQVSVRARAADWDAFGRTLQLDA